LAPIEHPRTAAEKIVNGAKAEARWGVRYDPGYVRMAYPGGDVPSDRGACTDVVIRALRQAGYDLQQLIHEDMRRHFSRYPKKWGLTRPDPNIDHRRVPNQKCFFQRHGRTLTREVSPQTLPEWQPGDLVYWKLDSGVDHCGVLSNVRSSEGWPLVIHNLSRAVQEDCLTAWEITGHFRYPATATVCLDPGHPSEKNSGRAVQNGTTELEMNWTVATQLRERLEEQGVRVVMTKRSQDEYVTNRRRAEIANKSGAALFFRIHCDTGKGSGLTTYHPAQAGVVHGIRGPSGPVRRASARAAHLIHAVMSQYLCPPLHDNGVKTDRQTAIGRRQGALTGSIFAKVPTVTVEMVYLSHPSDAAFIRSREGQERMVEVMSAAILEYVRFGEE
jgi:uncharacterized protein YijF (DUF1287 family)